MSIDWSPLLNELALYRRADLPIPLWWRDDDAVENTPALERLAGLARETHMPVHIAVIPSLLTASLPTAMADHPALIPVIHGWKHVSHAPQGAKNSEFGHARPEATKELGLSLRQMQLHFGPRLIPLFVPPWNRIAPNFLPLLTDLSYAGVSTYGPRNVACGVQGLPQINTHIDPIFWRGHRGLVDPDEIIANLVTTLRDRREGRTDVTEPLGLLTHHLVHTEAVWDFSRDVMQVMLEGGARPADLRAILLSRPSL